MELYLIEYTLRSEQYNGSTVAKFRARANNEKSKRCKFRKQEKLSNQQARNQKLYHEHCLQGDHNGICDWEITILDYA